MLLLGIVIGTVMTALYLGYRSDGPTTVGAGIRDLVKKRPGPVEGGAPAGDGGTVRGGAASDDDKAKKDLDFYTTLPNEETVVPNIRARQNESNDDREREKQARAKTKQPVAPETVATSESYYMIQVAAYSRIADADSLKAKLALQGLEAVIQRVTIQDKGDHFRVRLGPFMKYGELDGIEARLTSLGLSSMRLKIRGGG